MIHLQARKSLGQNFLVDPNAHQRIVRAIGPRAGETLIEIGPGTGLLTRVLLASPLERLIAFEIDTRAVPELRTEFAAEYNRFLVVEQDFLQADLLGLSEEYGVKLRVAGNIPYYITSPILFKLIDGRAAIRDAALLLQLEVAERLTAPPRTKAYGIPTVLANFFGEVTFRFKVPAGAFRPVPKVDSALVQIDFERGYFNRTGTTPPLGFDETLFRTLVRGLFAMRRKTIRNNLKPLVGSEVLARLESTAAPFLGRRAEELSIAEFVELTAAVRA